MWTRVTSNIQRSTCLCLQNAGIKGMGHRARWIWFFAFFLTVFLPSVCLLSSTLPALAFQGGAGITENSHFCSGSQIPFCVSCPRWNSCMRLCHKMTLPHCPQLPEQTLTVVLTTQSLYSVLYWGIIAVTLALWRAVVGRCCLQNIQWGTREMAEQVKTFATKCPQSTPGIHTVEGDVRLPQHVVWCPRTSCGPGIPFSTK